MRYREGKNSATLAALLNTFEKQPGSQEISDNSPSTFLSSDTGLKMMYPMRGGPRLDYKTGIDILDELYLYFYYETESSIDEHPCQGNVAVGCNIKFEFELDKVPVHSDLSNSTSTRIRLNGSTSSSFHGSSVDVA